MTLLEIFFASTLLLFVIAGVMGTLVQSRRITEANVTRNSTLVIVQGYLVQLKTMDLGKLIGAGGNIDSKGNPIMSTAAKYTVETVRGGDPANPGSVLRDTITVIPLSSSAGFPPDISTFTPGTSTSSVVDNLRNFDMQKDLAATTETSADTSSPATTGLVAWKTIWPKANDFPPYAGNTLVTDKAGVTDLKLNLWVWVKDLTNSTVNAQQVYGITIIYTYQVQDGSKVRYVMGSVRAIRSFVRTI
jgi:hypothetical protein